jgi:lipopolysaccharide transport system permease protein
MGSYLAAIWRCRYFWLSLVKMDLRTRYRRSVLGIGWSLLHPLAMTVVFCVVFCRLLKQDVYTYAPYVLAGLAFWHFVQGVTVQGCQCFFQGESYIRQYPAPMAIYPLRTVLGLMFHFLIALAVVFLLTAGLHGLGNPLPLLSLVPTLGLLFLFGWALAVLAGFANVFFQDTQHLTEVGFQVLFYATPVMYYPEMLGHGRLAKLLSFNPLVPFLHLVREPILSGRPPSATTFCLASGIVALMLAAATCTLVRLQGRLIFRL